MDTDILTKDVIQTLEYWFIKSLIHSPLVDGFEFEEVGRGKDAPLNRSIRTVFTSNLKQKQVDFNVSYSYSIGYNSAVFIRVHFHSGTHPSLSYSVEQLLFLDDFEDFSNSLSHDLRNAINQLEESLRMSLIDFIDYNQLHLKKGVLGEDYLNTFLFIAEEYRQVTNRVTVYGDFKFRLYDMYDNSLLARGTEPNEAYSDFIGEYSESEYCMILTSQSTGVYRERGIILEPTRKNIRSEFLYFIKDYLVK